MDVTDRHPTRRIVPIVLGEKQEALTPPTFIPASS